LEISHIPELAKALPEEALNHFGNSVRAIEEVREVLYRFLA